MSTAPEPQVWPTLRARDAQALIRFLTEAFGFEETVVYADGDLVHHAQLSWPEGGGIMLGSVRPGPAGENRARMEMIMIGHSQFRQAGGRGGAVPVGLSPGGGGFACLLMAAPCDAQYACSPWCPDRRAARLVNRQAAAGERPGSVR